jgi:hypothetical protein
MEAKMGEKLPNKGTGISYRHANMPKMISDGRA